MLTEEQTKSFADKGYIVLDNFFTKIELLEFRNMLTHVIRKYLKDAKEKYPDRVIEDFEGKELDEGVNMLEELNHQYIADIYDTIYQTSQFLRITSKKEISQNINQIIGRELDDPLYIDQSRCRIDTPFDPHMKKCGWHQEVFYYVPKSEFVQIWAPLIHDAKIENGAVEVCVGSHNKIAKQSNVKRENEKYPFIVDELDVLKYEKQVMEIKLGQLLIFSSKLIHRSGNNISKKVRYSLVGINHNLDNKFFSPPKFVEADRQEKFEKYYDSAIKKD
jgi:phytanoyl-CoA hydroxylase|tara:strand:- start:77 stop:904 length:828 start_codon:yes stop_codon:yes gene_type:complete